MDRHETGSGEWLDEVLRIAGIDPGRLPRVESSRRPVIERSNPWHDGAELGDTAVILDAARAASGDPGRLLFVTDLEEDPIARVQAAVQLARAAVARGSDVLLVDADIRHVGLSRWLPDRDLDAEGLVDVLQYGASVAAARRPTDIDGIDVLGVGSYRPDLSGIFGADDARRLQAQLRASASVVIVVAPAHLAAGEFHPLLRGVDAVVVSMHGDPSLADDLAGLLGHLSSRQLPLAGMFLWAGPGDADRFVDDALLERSRALPPANVGSPFPARRSEPAPEPGASSPDEEPGAPAADAEAGTTGDDADEPPRVRMYTERGNRRSDRRSSQALRLVMVVVAVGVVGFLGWWGLTWRSVEPTTRPRIQPPEARTSAARTPAEPVAEESGGPVPAEGTAEGSAAVVEPETEAAPDETAADGEPPAVETSRDLDGILEAPVESADALAESPGPEDPFEAALRRRGGGWALHLFSFADSVEAVTDAERLEREGYAAVVRGADIKGQRWYRVLVGDFADRAAAGRFREAAQEKFHVDWVGVVKK